MYFTAIKFFTDEYAGTPAETVCSIYHYIIRGYR